MDFTCIFFGILFTAAGLLFACGKGHIHLSMWKNMPKAERDKIKIAPLCRNIGAMVVLSGLIFLIKGFSGLTGPWFTAAMIVRLVLAGCDAWYIGKSKRYYSR